MKLIISIFLSLLLISNFLFAEEVLQENRNHSLYQLLSDTDLKNRLKIIENELIEFNVKKVPYKENDNEIFVPILSYLLLNGFTEEAIYLVNNNKLSPFETFNYKNNEMSDIVIAYENNIMDFIRAAIPKIENINKQFEYNGERGFTLLMLVATQKDQFTYEKTEILVQNGINLNLQSLNNLTAIGLADVENNRDFIEAYYTTQKLLLNDNNLIFTNTELSPKNKIAQNLLLKDIKNGNLDKATNYEGIFKKWTQLIVLGYNEAADKFYDKLITFDEFDINGVTDSGLSPLMATAISHIGGGNVEYASKLLDLGAKYDLGKESLTIPMIAIKKDNHKILALYFSKGLYLEDLGNLYKQALLQNQKAIKSAYIIKRSILNISKG